MVSTPAVVKGASASLLWMPRKLWQVLLHCPHDDCVKHPLTSAGLYPHVRQVLDLDGLYSLATKYLECGKCKRKVISWSQGILDQLDVGHRKQFPIIITYNYACDMRVVRLLRQHGFGNSSTQLQKKLTEQHKEQWLQRTAHYLTDCQTFVEASKRQLVLAPELDEPPSLPTLPKAGWLLTVYRRDVLSRVEEVKAYITSTFGSVLKIYSTKKVKYHKQIIYQAFISIVIFCLETPTYHEYYISSIPHSTPSPLPSSKNIPLVTQAIVIIITVSVIFFNFLLGY